MSLKQTGIVAILAIGSAVTGNSQAALYDRGGGLLYDDVLNVTWLQDANYSKTTVYQGNIYGHMTWNQAQTWAENLVYYDSIRNVNYTDWRLPRMIDTGTPGCNSSNNGTDCGQNVDTNSSELAHMFHVNLSLKSILSVTGTYQTDFGVFGNGNIGGQFNVGLVQNLQSSAYWIGTEYSLVPESFAWVFYTNYGSQYYLQKYAYDNNGGTYAWALRDGDVAATIPEPNIIYLFLAGLFSLQLNKKAGITRPLSMDSKN